jgi:putative heme iron utilization protein
VHVQPVPTDLKKRVADYLATDPRAMTLVMARELCVPEADIVRAFPDDRVTELAIGGERTLDLIRSLEAFGRVHVIASNAGCTLESYGYFGGFSLTGPYFNVQTDTIDMHIRHQQLTSAFALIKPSHQDGQTTYSIQFFDTEGRAAFKVFVYKSVTERDGKEIAAAVDRWREVCASFGATAS